MVFPKVWLGGNALFKRFVFLALLSTSLSFGIDEEEIRALNEQQLCALILEEIAVWGDVEASFLAAQAADPNDPIRRSLNLQWQLAQHGRFPRDLQTGVVPFEIRAPRSVYKTLPRRWWHPSIETNAWVMPKTQSGNWPSLRAIPDYALNTIRFVGVKDVRANRGKTYEVPFPESDRDYAFKEMLFHPNAHSRMVVDWAAGLTGVKSHSGRVFNQIRLMNSDRTNGLTMELLRGGANPLFFQTAAVTADRPFHGSGSSSMEYYSLEGSIDWRLRYYRSLKTAPATVLTAGSRSGESLLIGEVNYRNPGLFNGMIWMSPMHPTAGYKESIQGYRKDAVLTGVPLNPLAFRWFTEVRNKMISRTKDRWWDRFDPTNGTPLLIVVGEHDPEVSQEAREEFKRWAKRCPLHIFYVEVPGAGHDVFSVTEDTDGNARRWTKEAELRSAKAWAYVYWFMRTKILHESTTPPYGWLAQ